LFFPDFQQRLFKKTPPCAMIDEEKENNLQWSDVERIIGTMLREYNQFDFSKLTPEKERLVNFSLRYCLQSYLQGQNRVNIAELFQHITLFFIITRTRNEARVPLVERTNNRPLP
jgi:hypothetical protein